MAKFVARTSDLYSVRMKPVVAAPAMNMKNAPRSQPVMRDFVPSAVSFGGNNARSAALVIIPDKCVAGSSKRPDIATPLIVPPTNAK